MKNKEKHHVSTDEDDCCFSRFLKCICCCDEEKVLRRKKHRSRLSRSRKERVDREADKCKSPGGDDELSLEYDKKKAHKRKKSDRDEKHGGKATPKCNYAIPRMVDKESRDDDGSTVISSISGAAEKPEIVGKKSKEEPSEIFLSALGPSPGDKADTSKNLKGERGEEDERSDHCCLFRLFYYLFCCCLCKKKSKKTSGTPVQKGSPLPSRFAANEVMPSVMEKSLFGSAAEVTAGWEMSLTKKAWDADLNSPKIQIQKNKKK